MCLAVCLFLAASCITARTRVQLWEMTVGAPSCACFGRICNRFTGFVVMATYAANAKCQRGRLQYGVSEDGVETNGRTDGRTVKITNSIFGAASKEIYREILNYFGIDAIEKQIADRQSKFILI